MTAKLKKWSTSKAKNVLNELSELIMDELNIKQVAITPDEEELVNLKSKANYKTLGRRLGSKMKTAAESIECLNLDQIRSIQNGENISIMISLHN